MVTVAAIEYFRLSRDAVLGNYQFSEMVVSCSIHHPSRVLFQPTSIAVDDEGMYTSCTYRPMSLSSVHSECLLVYIYCFPISGCIRCIGIQMVDQSIGWDCVWYSTLYVQIQRRPRKFSLGTRYIATKHVFSR